MFVDVFYNESTTKVASKLSANCGKQTQINCARVQTFRKYAIAQGIVNRRVVRGNAAGKRRLLTSGSNAVRWE